MDSVNGVFSAEEIQQLAMETPTENVEYDDNVCSTEDDDNIVKLLTSEQAINEIAGKIAAEQKLRDERDRQFAEKIAEEQSLRHEIAHENKLSKEQWIAVRQKRMEEIDAKRFEINIAKNYETIERVERPMPRFTGNINDAHLGTPRYAKINYADDDYMGYSAPGYMANTSTGYMADTPTGYMANTSTGYMADTSTGYKTTEYSTTGYAQQANTPTGYKTTECMTDAQLNAIANESDLAMAAALGVGLSDLEDFDIYWKMYRDKNYMNWCQMKSCLFD